MSAAYQSFQQARDQEVQDFSSPTLFVRFGIPTLLLLGTLVSIIALLNTDNWSLPLDSGMREGMTLSAIGAYLSILLLLVQRNARRDLSSQLVYTIIAQLITGTILGALLTKVANPSQPDIPPSKAAAAALPEPAPGDEPANPPANDPSRGNSTDAAVSIPQIGYGFAALYLFAGFAPKPVIDAIVRYGRNGFGATLSPATRLVSLFRLRGITEEIALRLDEEGIQDACGLAYANPHRLLRSTPYDARQILSWMDQALLAVYLPNHWEKLEDFGISGIIDFAWYCGGASQGHELPVVSGIDPKVLLAAAQRAYQDDQVRTVWILYQPDAMG
ncbi:MAG: hypothetical protein IT428_08355 [Planctomycetaceae bacterium]|nr:hypothetical protein [Planctomycetaceae bacterium]